MRKIMKDDYCVKCGALLGCAIWDHKKKKLIRECKECGYKRVLKIDK